MRIIEQYSTNPRDSLALDAALFHELEASGIGEALRIWEADTCAVVVGATGRPAREVHETACRAAGIPVLHRITGGGAVVVGPGCLNYSLALSLEARPELRHVARSYRLILGRIAEALAVPGLAMEGTGDLAIDGRKISGSAQRRGRRALLHHGTFLYGFDTGLIPSCLPEPVRQPAYRAARPHADFVANAPLTPAAIRAALVTAWAGEAAAAGI